MGCGGAGDAETRRRFSSSARRPLADQGDGHLVVVVKLHVGAGGGLDGALAGAPEAPLAAIDPVVVGRVVGGGDGLCRCGCWVGLRGAVGRSSCSEGDLSLLGLEVANSIVHQGVLQGA